MALFDWNDNLSVTDPAMDAQHKILIRLINDLDVQITSGGEHGFLSQLFSELIDYTRVHFEEEEMRMLHAGYPDMKAHVEEHTRLTLKVMDLKMRFEEREPDMGPEILQFLKGWLTGHILGIDKKYVGKI